MAIRLNYTLQSIGSQERAETVLGDLRTLAIRHGFAAVGPIEHLAGEEAVLEWHPEGSVFYDLLTSATSLREDGVCETPAAVMAFRITFDTTHDVGMWIALALDYRDTLAGHRRFWSWRGRSDDLSALSRGDDDAALVTLVDRVLEYFASAQVFGCVRHFSDDAGYKRTRERALLMRAADPASEAALEA